MASTLARTAETAVAAILAANSAILAGASPQVADSSQVISLPDVKVQATPSGAEMVYQTGIYQVNVTVSAFNKPENTPTPDELIADANTIFANLNALAQISLDAVFASLGLMMFGVIPSQDVSSTVEGANRKSTCGIGLVCCLRPAVGTFEPFVGPNGGVCALNIDTGTRFEIILKGSDSAPTTEVVAIVEPDVTPPPGYYGPGPNGGFLIKNVDTGTTFEVVLSGTDAGPTTEILAYTPA